MSDFTVRNIPNTAYAQKLFVLTFLAGAQFGIG